MATRFGGFFYVRHLAVLAQWGVLVMSMHTSKKLRDLQQKKAALLSEARGLMAAADAESRDLTTEEDARYEALSAQIKSANVAIERENALLAEEASANVGKPGTQIFNVTDLAATDPKRGFKSKGEFFAAVLNAGVNNGVDARLSFQSAAPGTFGNEAAGADGGFLIPPEFSQDIWTLAQTEDSLLPLTDNYEVTSNSMVFPKDETTPWGADGIRAYWQQEGTQGSQTKPSLGTDTLRLHKLMGLVPMTDELLSDVRTLEQYITRKVADSIRWKSNEALLFGTGNGQPLGCFTGNAAVVQAKDSGQAANTLSLGNLTSMVAKLIPGCFPRAIWLVTPDALPALFGLTLGNYPIYLPVDKGAQNSPYGALLGRPIFVSQHASAFSSQGDIALVDPKYIRTITKAGGIETATSMHLFFDAGATAFRSIFRMDGQPIIKRPVAQAKGSANLSAYIQLAGR